MITLANLLIVVGCSKDSNKNKSPTFELLPQHTLESFHLQGKVKKMTQYIYTLDQKNGQFVQGELFDEFPAITTTEFNPEGLVTRVTIYERPQGAVVEKQEYRYDELHRLKSITYTNFTEPDVTEEKFEYTPEGHLSTLVIFVNGKLNSKIVYTTTATKEGYRLEFKSESPTNQFRTVNYYNRDNCLVKEENYYADTLQSTSNFVYDAQRRCVKEVFHAHTRSSLITSQFIYDKYGNLVNTIVDREGEDEAQNPADINHQEARSEYTYDSQGNVVRELRPDGEYPMIVTYQIEYY